MRFHRVLLFLFPVALSFTVSGQADRYSNPKAREDATARDALPPAMKNPAQFTSDGDFLRQAAEDHAFLNAVTEWAKDHGNSTVRNAAHKLAFEENQLGVDIHRFGDKKHIAISDNLNDADQAEYARLQSMDAGGVDHFFAAQTLKRYQDDITRFETEVRQGSDSDIKKWASHSLPTLRKHEQEVQRVQGELK